jgi:hypothetical protein
MLSLDRPGPVQSRHHGQHVRHSDDQAGPDTFAVVPRHDTSGAGRYLSRLAKTVLAGRLRPAVLAGRPDLRRHHRAGTRAGRLPA